ncbi:HAD family hydrolase [Megalodesulfovibrio paquesii]
MTSLPPAVALFDVDGVLVDSKSAYIGFYNDVLAHVGLPAMTAAQEVDIFSFTFEQGFEHLIPPPLRSAGRAYIDSTSIRSYLPKIRPMPEALDMLAHLRRKGLKLGVCTNGARKEVDIVFSTYGIAEAVHAVVTCDEAPRPKPNPDGLLLLLEQLQARRDQTVYVGDSPVDERAARAAGLEFWAFANPGLTAARHVGSHAELLRLFGV